MLRLIFVRHGKGEPSGNLGDLGRTQIQKASVKLKELGAGPQTLVLTSDEPRAAQSADIIAGNLGAKPAETRNTLRPSRDEAFVNREAGHLSDKFSTVVCVSHEDTIIECVAQLAGQRTRSANGQVIALEFPGSSWKEPGKAVLVPNA